MMALQEQLKELQFICTAAKRTLASLNSLNMSQWVNV